MLNTYRLFKRVIFVSVVLTDANIFRIYRCTLPYIICTLSYIYFLLCTIALFVDFRRSYFSRGPIEGHWRTGEINGLMFSIQLYLLISICCILSQAGWYMPMCYLARGSFLSVAWYLASCLTSHNFANNSHVATIKYIINIDWLICLKI